MWLCHGRLCACVTALPFDKQIHRTPSTILFRVIRLQCHFLIVARGASRVPLHLFLGSLYIVSLHSFLSIVTVPETRTAIRDPRLFRGQERVTPSLLSHPGEERTRTTSNAGTAILFPVVRRSFLDGSLSAMTMDVNEDERSFQIGDVDSIGMPSLLLFCFPRCKG